MLGLVEVFELKLPHILDYMRFFLTYHVSKRQQIESPHAPFVETPPPPLYELVYNTPTTPLQNGLNDGTYYFLGESYLELNLSTGDYVVIRKHMMLFQAGKSNFWNLSTGHLIPDIMVATIIGATTGVFVGLMPSVGNGLRGMKKVSVNTMVELTLAVLLEDRLVPL
ncbi:SH3 domain-containing protein 2 [Artemisia annua]|uniref:SH3 domain-containing protein 2 n=1 Tax=Artemisia annua TaxID=35608 RepID=A0A2U1LFF6_ARTAN|nr:SH3 domain-containing protein 2 [Artemisia annua]